MALNQNKGLGRRTPFIILGVAVAGMVLLVLTRPSQEKAPRPERAWQVATQAVAKESLRPTLSLYGRIESPRDATLTSALEADVIDVVVQEGAQVGEGDLLVKLDDRDARLDLMQRQADVDDLSAQVQLEKKRLARNTEVLEKEKELLALAEKNAARVAELYKDNLLSQANVDDSSETLKRQQLGVAQRELALEESELGIVQLRARLTRARALRDQSKLELDRTELRAPFAGLVSGLDVSPGDRVRQGDPIVNVFDPARLEVRTQIPTRYAPDIRRGLASDIDMPVQVLADGNRLEAAVTRLAGQTRAGSGGVDAFVEFGQPVEGLKLGSTVAVNLSLPPVDEVIAVPAEAIYGRDQLFRVVDGRMQQLQVERVGEQIADDGTTLALVRSLRLTADDEIVVTKLANPVDGLLVDSVAAPQVAERATASRP